MIDAIEEITVLILCGGKGTRSANPESPKALANIGSEPILKWQIDLALNSGIKSIWLLAGHKSNDIKYWLETQPQIQVNILEDLDLTGTLEPIVSVLAESNAEIFCIVSGDIMVGADLRNLAIRHLKSENQVSVVVHPNLHPETSDILFEDHNRRTHFFSKKQKSDKIYPNSSAAGIFFVSREVLMNFKDIKGNAEEAIFEWANRRKQLGLIRSAEYFSDTGTPNRLAKVREDFLSGKIARKVDWYRNAVLVDLDGTLCLDSNQNKKLGVPELFPDVLAWIKSLNTKGLSVFLVTNQPGISKGQFGVHELTSYLNAFEAILARNGVLVDGIVYCPHHPEIGFQGEITDLKIDCTCRKPKIGMIGQLEVMFGKQIEPICMVGDSFIDYEFAINAGIKFIHVNRVDECLISAHHECSKSLSEINF